MSRGGVYMASSLDGFIAGPDDDLSWLTGTDPGDRGPDPRDGWKDVFLDDAPLDRHPNRAAGACAVPDSPFVGGGLTR